MTPRFLTAFLLSLSNLVIDFGETASFFGGPDVSLLSVQGIDKTMCISPYYVRAPVGDPKYGCPPESERIGLYCYKGCPRNFDVVGLECWEKCRVNYTSTWWTYCNLDEWFTDHQIPCPSHSYCDPVLPETPKCRKCPASHRPVGCQCLPVKHFRKSMFRQSKVMWYYCPYGQEKIDGRCYRNCRENFFPAGKVCWQRCPSSHPNQLGAVCSANYQLDVRNPMYQVGTTIVEGLRGTTPTSALAKDPTAFRKVVEMAFREAKLKMPLLYMCRYNWDGKA